MKSNLILAILILGSISLSLAYNYEESFEDEELLKLGGLIKKGKEALLNKGKEIVTNKINNLKFEEE